MSNFNKFSAMVSAKIDAMGKGSLFMADVDPNEVWEQYLAAFPEGTNPLFRERTEHDCACCRSFIRNMGHMIRIDDGEIVTIWDIKGAPYPYDVVAAKLAEFVRAAGIKNVYLTPQPKHGAATSLEMINDRVHTWNHFVGKVPTRFVARNIAEILGEKETVAKVFQRGLEELADSAVETVLELIKENLIYRGAEFKSVVSEFKRVKAAYRKINDPVARDIFVWENLHSPAARFRNTVIGTLVQDLSDGVDMDKAVKAFESKVAPTNYKRPKALITPKMIKNAVGTLRELGLETAIERRLARLADVSVNNVLFVDNEVQDQMMDGLEGLLMEEVKPAKVDIRDAVDITVEAFMEDVVPKAKTLDLLVSNRHMGNFMSLTAPAHPDTGRLFKWNNDFAWSYDGDVTDGIRERVKKAGGNVSGKMRVSLAWHNSDDLDIHVYEPNGAHIYFGNRQNKLDVDMNASSISKNPVENVCWNGRLTDGVYRVDVDNYRQRSHVDTGFELEVEYMGHIQNFRYTKHALRNRETLRALELEVRKGELVSVKPCNGVIGGSTSQEKWGIATETLQRVNTLMLSPNHWDDQNVGNKHWFFILKDCQNPNSARGIYNEFLNGALEKHRKVFEVLGTKTKCAPSEEQLSGLGFSSTRKDEAIIVAKGEGLNRAYNIKF